MEYFEGQGRSVEEALDKISELLGVSKDALDYAVVTQKKRLLGFLGTESVQIKAWRRQEGIKRPLEVIQRILDLAGFDCTLTAQEQGDEPLLVEISGTDQAAMVGKDGEVLEALQFLTNKIVNRGRSQPVRIFLDTGGFRDRRREELKGLATRYAAQVRATGQSVALPPLNAHDRRIIHLELKDDSDLFTKSLGQGHFKKVMIGTRRSQDDPMKARRQT